MGTWQLHLAKARFSELLSRAEHEGPQIITRHGKEAAVVLSAADYHRLEAGRPDFRDYLLAGPKVDAFEVARDPDTGRDIEL
jgi:antitoxin Phd